MIADQLDAHLPGNFDEKYEILEQILGEENPEETGMFTEYYWLMPMAKWIEKYGLNHFKTSMKAIEEITKRNTGEYTIRPFIEKYPERTLKVMLKWSKNKNRHIRRLAIEGVRPRLPWASKLQMFIDDPQPILPILENLKDDPSKYVQKSVANNINDILKDNYTIGMELLQKWTSTNPTKPRKWIIKHALRKRIKEEDSKAIELLEALK